MIDGGAAQASHTLSFAAATTGGTSRGAWGGIVYVRDCLTQANKYYLTARESVVINPASGNPMGKSLQLFRGIY